MTSTHVKTASILLFVTACAQQHSASNSADNTAVNDANNNNVKLSTSRYSIQLIKVKNNKD